MGPLEKRRRLDWCVSYKATSWVRIMRAGGVGGESFVPSSGYGYFMENICVLTTMDLRSSIVGNPNDGSQVIEMGDGGYG